MSFMLSSVYDSINYNFSLENSYPNGYNLEVSQEVGYNWYQSCPSSDVMAASPCSCGCQTSSLQSPVSNPYNYYPVEYKPPEPPPLSPYLYTTEFCAPYTFVDSPNGVETPVSNHSHSYDVTLKSCFYPPSFTCVDTPPIYLYSSPHSQKTPPNTSQSPSAGISLNSPDVVRKVIESKLFDESPSREFIRKTQVPGAIVCNVSANLNSTPSVLQRSETSFEAPDSQCNDGIKLVEEVVSVHREVCVDEVEAEPQVFDKRPERKSTPVNNIVNGGELNNPVDESVVLKIFSKSQKSSSIVEYVELFMDNISKVESAFGRKFQDDLLCYSFVVGLKGKLRDALELLAPQTLQEAIYLATFQELLLEENLLGVNVEMEPDKGLKDLELQVETVIDTSDCDKKLFRRVCGGEKQMVAEEIPAMVLRIEKMVNNKVREIIEAPVDNVDVIVIIPTCVNDLQRQKREDWVMQIIKEPTITIIACRLGMKSSNIGEENFLIFDPGGDVHNKRPASVHKLFKIKIGSKVLKLEEVIMVNVMTACGHLSEFKEPVNFYCIPGNSFKEEVKSDVQVISIQPLLVKLDPHMPLWEADAIADKILVKVIKEKIVYLVADDMLIGFRLKFLALIQLLDEHFELRESDILFQMGNTSRSQGQNAQEIQNENNKNTAELFNGELNLEQNMKMLWNSSCLDVLLLSVNTDPPSALVNDPAWVATIRSLYQKIVREWIIVSLSYAPCTIQGLLQENLGKENTWKRSQPTTDVVSLLSEIRTGTGKNYCWTGTRTANIPAVMAAAAASGANVKLTEAFTLDVLGTGVVSATGKCNYAGEIAGMRWLHENKGSVDEQDTSITSGKISGLSRIRAGAHSEQTKPRKDSFDELLLTRFVCILQKFVFTAEKGGEVDKSSFRETCSQATALLLSNLASDSESKVENFSQLLRLICWCSACIFTPDAMETGVFIWTWLVSAAPQLGPLVLAEQYPLKPYQILKKEYYFIDQFVCKRLTSEKSKVHVMVHAQNISSSWKLDGAHDVALKDGAMVYVPDFSIMIYEDESGLVFPEERKLFNSMICTRILLEKGKEVVQYMFMEIKRLVQGVLKVCAELDNGKELEVSLLKMTTLSWYLNIIIVVFDPGGDSGYLQNTLPMVFILEDKDILRRRDCNQLEICGLNGLAL